MTTIEALHDVIKLSNQNGTISWAWISRVKRLAKQFQVTPDEMLGLITDGWTVEKVEAWLTKNKPKVM